MIKRNLAGKTSAMMATVNPVPARAYEDDPRAVNEIAARLSLLRSAEPVGYEPVGYQQAGRSTRNLAEPDGIGRARALTWRVAAPVLSGLAVAAVLAGLVVAGAAPARRGVGTPSVPAMPRYYLTINGLPPHAKAVVHSTRTGRTLTSVSLPKATEVVTAAAAPSAREFFLAIVEPGKTNPNTYLFRLSLSASGHWHLSARTLLISSGGQDIVGVTGIAVSPDGSRLAAAIVDFRGTSVVPVSKIKIVPLRGGPARVWTAPSHPADSADLVWASDTSLAFLWLDHLKVVKQSYYAVRGQERLLDTSAPGNSLLSSRVLAAASGSHAFQFDSAYLARGANQIIASVFRNTPFAGARGTAVVRLVALSPATGKVIKVLTTRTVRYSSTDARIQADSSLQVFGVDASGRYALIRAPRFGILSAGVFSPEPTGPGLVDGAAW